MSYDYQYDPTDGIAIVGMAGRFPGANSVGELWRNLLEGRESISRFTRDELEPAHPEDMDARGEPGYVCARGVLEGVDQFDEAFFGFTPAEAALLDPQQRLFLQTAWEALEHAGYDPSRFGAPIGVYAGGTANSYYLNNLQSRRDVTDRLGLLTTQMANQGHYIATRTAYKLDLKGPALNIHTACSTSLVAVCTAVQSLQTFQCDMALAGGVSVTVPQKRGYLHQEGSILSPDGHCRAFDAAAQGTVFSNGLGVVVLRRLQDAIDDGDTIYAVIKGAALNNDGSGKLSFTAPSVDGQAEVVALAQALAGIDPQTISYVEAHGTGTALGDPIEIAGLTQAFRAGGAEGTGFCAIGSLKTNVGHMDAAAGVAGLIKTALALHHRQLPASLHFRTPNPKLQLEQTPFFVNDTLRDWPNGPTPRRAGVSSFGVGGTNAHVVLEEAPRRAPIRELQADRPSLLMLSGRDEPALLRARDRLLQWLQDTPPDALPRWHDMTRTLQEGRRAFSSRAAWVCRDRDDALAALAAPLGGLAAPPVPRGVAFLFPGQGAQQVDMGRSLYRQEPVFRREIDACAERLLPVLGLDLRALLFPADSDETTARGDLAQTAVTQPALFAVEWALAQQWLALGVQPQALLGHSVGEYVAACLGGTFTRDDALMLVAARARLMQSLPAGSMLAVRASADDLQPHLTSDISIAAINAPQATVLSGETEALARLAGMLEGQGIASRPLATSHAFHSPMMEPILERFATVVAQTPRQAPRLPWLSSLTGAPITDEQAVSPAYWVRQLREPVRFSEAIGTLLDGDLALLEVGPGAVLGPLARRQGRALDKNRPVVASLPQPGAEDERVELLAAAAQLWCAGVPLDLAAVQPGPWQRVALPAYPFARNRRWVEPAPRGLQPQAGVLAALPTPAAESLALGASTAVDADSSYPSSVPMATQTDNAAVHLAATGTAVAPALAPSTPLTEPAQIVTVAAAAVAPPPATPEALAASPAPTPILLPVMTPVSPASLAVRLQQLFAELSGLEVADVQPDAHFLELGLDSLTLTQASQSLQKRFGLKVPMRLLLEDCTTVQALAEHLAPQLPPEPVAAPAPAPTPTPATTATAPASGTAPTPAGIGPVAPAVPAAAATLAALPPSVSPAGPTPPASFPALPATPGFAALPSLPTWPAPSAGTALPPSGSGPWMQLFAQQLAIMGRQLELMLPGQVSGAATAATWATGAQADPSASSSATVPASVEATAVRPLTADTATAPSAATFAAVNQPARAGLTNGGEPGAGHGAANGAHNFTATPSPGAAFGPYRPPVRTMTAGLDATQQVQLREFIERYNLRTAGSKAATQRHRPHLADPRSVAGFRLAWKELVYPLVTVRSAGSRLRDVDGNEYIDITNGFGMIFFGHNPDFVREAVQAQLEAGYEIGPQTQLAGEVAQRVCEMVGQERAALCSTGSEAVMAAIRVSRTVTGRDTIVMFNGAYHGIFDEVLMRPGRAPEGQAPRSVPVSPGVPSAMGENIVVLDYGTPEALRTIRALGPQLAAVLVEPVQSRRPELQPREFLQELRRITAEHGTALVFDEVVTGFRVHPGGAQAVFGVKADIATYGKVVGGGLPIGIVAGSARFLDALDGGAWQYGDDSTPDVGVTFFAGTFVRHPLALAAARAVLQRLRDEGPELQRQMNLRTTRFVERLRAVAHEVGVPLQLSHFASWFCFQLPADQPLAPLFFAALRLHGLHAWEGRPCFLTTAHSDADLDAIVEAVRASLREMLERGFLLAVPAGAMNGHAQSPVPGARRGRDREGREAWFLPDPARPGKFLQLREDGARHA